MRGLSLRTYIIFAVIILCLLSLVVLYIVKSRPKEVTEPMDVPENQPLFQQPIVSPANVEPDDSRHPSNL